MKVLTFGFGSIAQRHISNILDACDIDSLYVYLPTCSSSIDYRPHYRHPTFPITRIISPEQLASVLGAFNHDDLVLIASPSIFHVEQLRSALTLTAINKPIIIVEKPLAVSSNQVADLLRLSSLDTSSTYVVSQYRASAAYEYISDIVASQRLGRFRFASIVTHEAIALWHPWEDFRNSYAVRKELGGGCFLTQMHDLDIIFSLCGLPQSAHLQLGSGGGLRINCDDYYSLIMSNFSASPVLSVNCQVSYYCSTPLREHSYVFDEGSIHVNLLSSELRIRIGLVDEVIAFPNDRNLLYQSVALAIKTKDILSTCGLVPFSESLRFHSWLCSLYDRSAS